MLKYGQCEFVQNKLIGLESLSRIPFLVRVHLFFCPECRKEAERMFSLLDDMRSFEPLPEDFDISDRVMEAILALSPAVEAKNVSMAKWIGVGFIILISMVLVRFSKTYLWVSAAYGNNFEVSVYIVFGIVLTVYTALFIGSHLEEFSHYASLPKDDAGRAAVLPKGR
jgi:hypothetical protein